MIFRTFPIQAFITLTIIASSLISSVNAAPRHSPIVDIRQLSQQELDADAMSKCVPQSNPSFSCFNATLIPDSSGTVPFDTCANSAVPGPSICLRACGDGGGSATCFQGLCSSADTTTTDCLGQYFYNNVVSNSN